MLRHYTGLYLHVLRPLGPGPRCDLAQRDLEHSAQL